MLWQATISGISSKRCSKLLARDLESFGEFAREVLQTLPAVKEIYSSFSYKSVKPQRMIPVAG